MVVMWLFWDKDLYVGWIYDVEGLILEVLVEVYDRMEIDVVNSMWD